MGKEFLHHEQWVNSVRKETVRADIRLDKLKPWNISIRTFVPGTFLIQICSITAMLTCPIAHIPHSVPLNAKKSFDMRVALKVRRGKGLLFCVWYHSTRPSRGLQTTKWITSIPSSCGICVVSYSVYWGLWSANTSLNACYVTRQPLSWQRWCVNVFLGVVLQRRLHVKSACYVRICNEM